MVAKRFIQTQQEYDNKVSNLCKKLNSTKEKVLLAMYIVCGILLIISIILFIKVDAGAGGTVLLTILTYGGIVGFIYKFDFSKISLDKCREDKIIYGRNPIKKGHIIGKCTSKEPNKRDLGYYAYQEEKRVKKYFKSGSRWVWRDVWVYEIIEGKGRFGGVILKPEDLVWKKESCTWEPIQEDTVEKRIQEIILNKKKAEEIALYKKQVEEAKKQMAIDSAAAEEEKLALYMKEKGLEMTDQELTNFSKEEEERKRTEDYKRLKGNRRYF